MLEILSQYHCCLNRYFCLLVVVTSDIMHSVNYVQVAVPVNKIQPEVMWAESIILGASDFICIRATNAIAIYVFIIITWRVRTSILAVSRSVDYRDMNEIVGLEICFYSTASPALN